MKFVVPFDDVATSGNADVYDKTIAAVETADTLGHRCRFTKLVIGPADDAPADLNIGIQLQRINTTRAVGGTGTAVTVAPVDPQQRATILTAKKNFTVEPTIYSDVVYQAAFNRRSGLIEEWPDCDGPVCNRNNLLGLLAATRTAVAAQISGRIEVEEF